MTILRKEMRQGWTALWIWAGASGGMMLLCILLFPEMRGQMDSVTAMFSNMGEFTAAFGLDRVNFGEIMGFYAVECGNILSIGCGFYAALMGVAALAKEEGGHTSEFLLTHPVRRSRVLGEKLMAVVLQVVLFNLIVLGFCGLGLAIIQETIPWGTFLLIHGAYLLLGIQLSCICFGISAFLRRSNAGLGLGIAALLFFANILCNISQEARILGYITPFAYADASAIVAENSLDGVRIAAGAGWMVLSLLVGSFHYQRKDLMA